MTAKARNKAILVAVVLTAAAVIVSLLPMIASTSTDPIRDVRIITRDMTFYLEGSDVPNPTLTFRAGERVRILLKNEDDGMDHDFSVPAWQVKTKLLTGRGEDALVLQVPNKTGTEAYTCTPHAEIMRGTIRIE